MQLITGYTGQNHVTGADDSIRNTMLGEFEGKGVFPVFDEFEAVAITANEVRVKSGYGINQGRLFRIDRNYYDSCTIENGTSGMKRVDLIVNRYTLNEQTGIETMQLVVIKGTPGNSYVDPAYTQGNILNGALQDDMVMYRVKINGIAIEAVEQLFTVYESMIGGIETVVNRITTNQIDSKLAAAEARYNNLMTSDHNDYVSMKTADDNAFQTWFAQVQSYLDEETATRLTNAVTKHATNFAAVESTTTASQAYAVDKLLVYDNNLYKVTAAIEINDTIIIGTNVVKANLGDIIAEMKVNFQDGVDAVYNACVAEGVTPSSSTPTAIASAMGSIRSGGNATAAQIEKGKTAYVNKSLVTGTRESTGTYTFASGDTGGTKDLGAQNTYRYVNASNVYNKGVADDRARTHVKTFNIYGPGLAIASTSADCRAGLIDTYGATSITITPIWVNPSMSLTQCKFTAYDPIWLDSVPTSTTAVAGTSASALVNKALPITITSFAKRYLAFKGTDYGYQVMLKVAITYKNQ